jgi:hypothetical protein
MDAAIRGAQAVNRFDQHARRAIPQRHRKRVRSARHKIASISNHEKSVAWRSEASPGISGFCSEVAPGELAKRFGSARVARGVKEPGLASLLQATGYACYACCYIGCSRVHSETKSL